MMICTHGDDILFEGHSACQEPRVWWVRCYRVGEDGVRGVWVRARCKGESENIREGWSWRVVARKSASKVSICFKRPEKKSREGVVHTKDVIQKINRFQTLYFIIPTERTEERALMSCGVLPGRDADHIDATKCLKRSQPRKGSSSIAHAPKRAT